MLSLNKLIPLTQRIQEQKVELHLETMSKVLPGNRVGDVALLKKLRKYLERVLEFLAHGIFHP